MNITFKLRNLKTLKYFLNLKITRSKKNISIYKNKYTLNLLKNTKLLTSKPSLIHINLNTKLYIHSTKPLLKNQTTYKKLIKHLIYLTITKPNINFTTNKLDQFTSTPKKSHHQTTLNILYYLKNTSKQNLFYYIESNLILKKFSETY